MYEHSAIFRTIVLTFVSSAASILSMVFIFKLLAWMMGDAKKQRAAEKKKSKAKVQADDVVPEEEQDEDQMPDETMPSDSETSDEEEEVDEEEEELKADVADSEEPESKVQGGNILSKDTGRPPVPMEVEKTNMWRKEDYTTTKFDVSPQTCSRNFDEFVNVVGRNCVHIMSTGYGNPPLQRPGMAVCVGGHVYLTNNHVLPECDEFILKVVSNGDNVDGGVSPNIAVKMTRGLIHRFPEMDVALFELNVIPPRKDLRSYFMKATLDGSFNCMLVGRARTGLFVKRAISHVQYQERELDGIVPTKFWRGYCDLPTKRGECGSALVAKSSFGPIILGIHVAGSSDTTLTLPVSHEFLMEETEKFTHMIVQSGEPELTAPSATPQLSSQLHFKSPITYAEKGAVAGVYGSFVNSFRGEMKSRVRPTLMSEACKKRGYETKFGRPATGWEPWTVALKDLMDPVLMLDQDVLLECADGLADDIIEGVGDELAHTLHVLDMDTTVNGAPGVAYIDSLNRSTSAGFPWKTSKKAFLEKASPRNGLQDPVDVSREILDRVEKIISKYHAGERAMPVFSGSLKDEPLKFKKIAAKKTRVFTGSPVDFSLVMRKYLLTLARLVQNNRFVCESAPGTNPHSKEWEEIRKYLIFFGEDRMIAGDYAAFDKRMCAALILLVFRVIGRLCKESGNYTAEDLKVIAGIGEDLAFALVDFNGDLIEFLGGNPSGQILTVIVNCFANAIYMRYCFVILARRNNFKVPSPRSIVRSFKEFIRLITYGDDNAMGASKSVPWFNHTAIQGVLQECGIEYTMADKEAKSVPFIHIDDVTFLKRSWRWDADIGAYVCPLDHSSIEKSLMVWVESRTITAEQQAVASMVAQCTEYFWYGKDVFHEKRTMFKEIVDELGLQKLVDESTFPTWSQLYDRFHYGGPAGSIGSTEIPSPLETCELQC